MLVFATSDKGGTGRSVTGSNIVYRRALHGEDVCYVDFDFGSPTAGAIFNVGTAERGTDLGGMHSYLQEKTEEPHRVDIWAESDRGALRGKPPEPGSWCCSPEIRAAASSSCPRRSSSGAPGCSSGCTKSSTCA